MWRRILKIPGRATAGCEKYPSDAPFESSPPRADAREKSLARIGDINDFHKPRPLVTLTEFFDGNNDFGSIGYNLPDSPSPQEWYQLLKDVARRPAVKDVRIEVMDLEDPNGWPSTDTIWIIATASSDEVRNWLPEHIVPDEVWDGLQQAGRPAESYLLPAGCRAVGLWYD